ncbi:MAG TPA: GNAT family N-acetyltransferase [Thermoleophilaceae bacterium]
MTRAAPAVSIRRMREDDAHGAARLVHMSAAAMYDLTFGDRRRALRFIERSLGRQGPGPTREAVWVAERSGRVVGVLLAFAADAAGDLARRFLWQTLRHTPPWRWPTILRLERIGERHAPRPQPGSFYVDALATDPAHRRAGVAAALLAHAERHALAAGFDAVSLDTAEGNEGAAALYRSAGYSLVERVPAHPPIPPAIRFVKELGQ